MVANGNRRRNEEAEQRKHKNPKHGTHRGLNIRLFGKRTAAANPARLSLAAIRRKHAQQWRDSPPKGGWGVENAAHKLAQIKNKCTPKSTKNIIAPLLLAESAAATFTFPQIIFELHKKIHFLRQY
jgi:hypothetical protein